MRFSKRIITAVLAVCLCMATVGVFASCGKSSDIKIVLMADAGQNAYYTEYFESLSEQMGIKIDYTGYAFQDYEGQLKTEMQNDPPDIFYVRPGDLKKFTEQGLLADFNSYIASDDFTSRVDLSKIYEHAVDIYRYDGVTVGVSDKTAPLYGMNLGFSYQGLGYNRKLVQRKASAVTAAGLPLPWQLGTGSYPASYTFAQFEQLLGIVKDSTGGGLNGTDKIFGMDVPKELMPFIWTKGGDILSSGKVTVNNQVFEDVLNYIKRNKDNGNMDISATWGEWSTDQVVFFSEVGSWEVASYVKSGFDFDMMPWPTENSGDNWYGQIGTSALAVYKNSKNADVAMEIASGFLTERTHDQMLKKGLTLPFYTATAEGGYLSDNETYKPANRKIFIDVISGKNGKYSPLNNTYNATWYDEFSKKLDVVWNGTQSVKDFLAEKQTSMQTFYDQK